MNVARFGLVGLAALAACRATPNEPPAEAPGPAGHAETAAADAAKPPDSASAARNDADAMPRDPDAGSSELSGPTGPPAPAALGEPAPSESVAQTPTDPAAIEDQRAAAIRAIEDGDFASARDLLEELIVGSRLQEGVRLLAAGQALEAVALLEDVRHEAPGRQDTLLPFAEASLHAGRQLGESALIERALGAFTQLDGEPAAAFGASRAAAALGRTDEALRFAREGLRRLDARGTTSPLAEPGERTWARAALASYYLARANQSAEADALRVECEDALARYLGTNAPDGWIWVQLGALAESDGRFEEARSAYERGLHRASSETALLDGLWRAARELGGFDAAAAALTRVLGSHPELARARFDLGVTRFELALAKNDASSVAEYARAEADLAAARRADPSLESAALGWEAMCRAGVGWTRLAANDLVGARAAFESMETLYPGGLRCTIEGRMRSGVEGLTYVGAGFQRAGALEDAAATFQRLFEYEPGNLDFANNAGLFARDLADKLAGTADDLARASRGDIRDPARLAELRAAAELPRSGADDEASRRALARAADALRANATRLFEQSFAAYEKAAELAPEDVRILNDVALIQVYYLKRDWDRARGWLLRAVELGERQLADTTLAKDRRFELENAWGDAHENLGVLALEHDHDVAAARKWFQRAVEIGPDPRPKVTDVWLKQCDGLEARR
ncbi:MAG: hypothetical protein HZA52_01915 [Planctomycetes bacterium]|nr:hypothetical protein [Planctomycetota bacterium]